ncbi:M14 family metallopeptidase [Halovivax sp.]|uniref:M14 family metallopeptidase n=1 Tax=Halovivax sp. TaxID=1935978 RepID=UPI0025C4433B|nr:M14 family metallopeptidase [Halovivax sp.]
MAHQHHDTDPTLDDVSFDDVPIDRRDFMRLSAVVGGALALPGAATADAESDVFDDEYQYILNHTPDDFLAPTLIRFTDESGVEEFESLDVGEEAHTTTESEPAGYAQLTTAEAEVVADLPTAEELSYTPGSNPFWRLGYYPMGVFPAVERSVDFIHYEQMIDGMEHLESAHADQLKFYALADRDNPHEVDFDKSPGHHNTLTDRVDPKDIHVVELTNPPEGYDTVEEFRDTDEFGERQKVMYEASIHGLERAGPEACYRFVERIVSGREPHFERLLDDCVLIVLSVNPDGWVARDPQYDSAWQLLDGDGRDATRFPAWPQYERGNSMVFDTNRQYPTVGWIDPNHHPGEPDEDRWYEDNPHEIVDRVPDAMGTVEHFRQYENLTHGADLHAMLWNSDFILGLINQIEFTQDEFHDLYEMNLVLEESLEGELDEWEALADLQEGLTGDINPDLLGFDVLPETAYDFSTIWDTIGYTITGGLIGFMGADEDRGGLDMTTMAFEMAYSHMVGGNKFEPVLADWWVEGYLEAMRTMTEYALRDVDSDLETRSGETETVAYVETDALTRTHEDLDFWGTDPDEYETELVSYDHQVEIDAEAVETYTIDVEEGLHTLSVHTHAERALVDVVLRDPDGEEVRAYRPSETGGAAHHDYPPFVVREPGAGAWTVEIQSLMTAPSEVSLDIATLAADGEHPDPRSAMGFAQEAYEVTPLAFFEDFDADNTTVETVALTPEEVAEGVDADHLVIVHDDGRGEFVDEDGADRYVAAIDAFVADGGNLVLTDSGLGLLEDMETALAVEAGDVRQIHQDVPHLEEKDADHPLLTDTREIQRMTYKIAPLGIPYAEDAPLWVVDADGWAASGGTVAGASDGDVSAGSLFTDEEDWHGIHVIGGYLPPANQTELHPFGLKNYVLAYFGLTVFTNALGAQQERIVDGEQVRSVGDVAQEPIYREPEEPEPELEAEGEREDSGSVLSGGQTNRTELDVAVTEPEGREVLVRDTVPENWTVDEEYGDVDATTPAFGGGTHVYFGLDDPRDAYEALTHFAQAPDDLEDTGEYTFGPIAVTDETGDEDTLTDREWTELDGTDRDVSVVAEDV